KRSSTSPRPPPAPRSKPPVPRPATSTRSSSPPPRPSSPFRRSPVSSRPGSEWGRSRPSTWRRRAPASSTGSASPMRCCGAEALCMRMRGPDLFRAAVTELLQVTRDLLSQCGLGVEDITLLIPHQANGRIIAALTEHLGLPAERVYANLARYGNTSAASVPLALDEAWRGGRLHEGDLLVLNAV